jgi:uncharacterized protein
MKVLKFCLVMIPKKEIIIKLLFELFPDAKIYLFGSRARGTYRHTSDIDLAIDTGHQISSLEMAKAQHSIELSNISQKVDLIDINSIPLHMREIILKEGILWIL